MMVLLVVEKLSVVKVGMGIVLRQELPDCDVILCHSLEEFGKRAERIAPALILIGLTGLTSNQGLTVVSRSKELFSNATTFVYGSDQHRDSLNKYYGLGVMGYSTLDAASLLHGVKSVMTGKSYFSIPVLESADSSSLFQTSDSAAKLLTTRQYQVACYLAKGMSTSFIAKRFGIKPSTVSTFKMQIFQRLNVYSVVDLPSKLGLSR